MEDGNGSMGIMINFQFTISNGIGEEGDFNGKTETKNLPFGRL